jgi:hypothetical protein
MGRRRRHGKGSADERCDDRPRLGSARQTLPDVQAELRGYAPRTAADVVSVPAWARRRVALWHRVDMLTKAGVVTSRARRDRVTWRGNDPSRRPPILYRHRRPGRMRGLLDRVQSRGGLALLRKGRQMIRAIKLCVTMGLVRPGVHLGSPGHLASPVRAGRNKSTKTL